MDFRDALKSDNGRFLEDISLSVKKIIFANFPALMEEEKEEIDQDVKLKILKMAARGKKVGNLRSYIWKMVYTAALDAIAHRIPAVSLDDAAGSVRLPLLSHFDSLTPDALYEGKELLALLEKVIDALPARRRTVVLAHLQGMSLEETALHVRESENAVRHLLYRGLEDVKAGLAALLANGSSRPRRIRRTQIELKQT